MLDEWREAGGKLKDLFRLALAWYDKSGKFLRAIEELRTEEETQDDEDEA